VILAICLAPFLTTLTAEKSWVMGILVSALVGVAISLSGFLGDINMSAIKRDAGVKDGSAILPGMGGVIDRIDSLIFTAPVFYYLNLLLAAY
jgi:phosphatidate cytidylyltransferase